MAIRQYMCACEQCGERQQLSFPIDNYPKYGQAFPHYCKVCMRETLFSRVLTKKTRAELNRKAEEEALRKEIIDVCGRFGFACKFWYQSVIISTPLCDWMFDYHLSKKTLYHESSYGRISLDTGLPVKYHMQFKNIKLTIPDTIKYIASHDRWRMNQAKKKQKLREENMQG